MASLTAGAFAVCVRIRDFDVIVIPGPVVKLMQVVVGDKFIPAVWFDDEGLAYGIAEDTQQLLKRIAPAVEALKADHAEVIRLLGRIVVTVQAEQAACTPINAGMPPELMKDVLNVMLGSVDPKNTPDPAIIREALNMLGVPPPEAGLDGLPSIAALRAAVERRGSAGPTCGCGCGKPKADEQPVVSDVKVGDNSLSCSVNGGSLGELATVLEKRGIILRQLAVKLDLAPETRGTDNIGLTCEADSIPNHSLWTEVSPPEGEMGNIYILSPDGSGEGHGYVTTLICALDGEKCPQDLCWSEGATAHEAVDGLRPYKGSLTIGIKV